MRVIRHTRWAAVLGILVSVFPIAVAGPVRAQTSLAKANAEQNPDVHVDVIELKRTGGDTVTLKARITNESTKKFRGIPVDKAYLLDTTHKNKQMVARDESKHCLCSKMTTVEAKARAEIWAKFAAPPADVQKLTVILPGFSPLEDVPVGQ